MPASPVRPIHALLASTSPRLSGHMPGHKGRAPFGVEDLFALDTTELPVTDDLYAPEGAIAEAEALYAEAAGAGATLFLTGGSSAGIAAMLLLWAKRGDTVLLPRNAHHSAVDACQNFGLNPVWIPVRQQPGGKVYVAEADTLQALAAHQEAKAILLTCPDYDGACMPLQAIAQAAHAQGCHLLVDEAHGAHFPWLDGWPSARDCADAWVQSVHKTLPGLTGSAVLHLRERSDHARALQLLRRTQSSSPSFLLLQSIDDARAWMELSGRERLRACAEAVAEIRRLLPSLGYADGQLSPEGGYRFDPTRLVIAAPQGGACLEQELRALGLDAEKADRETVTLILTASNTAEDFVRIKEILRRIPAHQETLLPLPPISELPPRFCVPWQADSYDWEAVPIAEASGRVSAVSAGLYPPGVPLVVAGEIIPREAAQLLAEAAPRMRFGLEEDQWLVLKDAP